MFGSIDRSPVLIGCPIKEIPKYNDLLWLMLVELDCVEWRVSRRGKPVIYEARESSLVSEGFLTAQFLQKLYVYESFCCDVL